MDQTFSSPLPGWNTIRGKIYVLNINSIKCMKNMFIFVLNRLNESLIYTGREEKDYLKCNNVVKYMQNQTAARRGGNILLFPRAETS